MSFRRYFNPKKVCPSEYWRCETESGFWTCKKEGRNIFRESIKPTRKIEVNSCWPKPLKERIISKRLTVVDFE